jgi:hypothetical protein
MSAKIFADRNSLIDGDRVVSRVRAVQRWF